MKTAHLDTEESQYKAYAAQDARMKSYAASTAYSDKEKHQAERIKLGLEMVYEGKGFYITFRKKFVSVKIDSPRVCNKASLKLLEADYEILGVTKVETPQGIMYRIPKQ